MINIFKDLIFPFSELYKSTKSINKKIDSLNNSNSEQPYSYEYASKNGKLKDQVLLDTLKETIESKKILEDKAKSSLIAITLSSTIIFNIVKFMQDTNNSIPVLIILAIISFFSLIYMIIAGVLSLYSIGEINKVSIMFPEDYLLGIKEKKAQIADNIEYNYLNNLKRNNFMTVSYKCMITSISFLIVIFIVSTVISFQGHKSKDELQVLKNEIEAINDKISTINLESTNDRQSIMNIQQTLLKVTNDNVSYENKLKDIGLLIEEINRKIENNQNECSKDIREIILELKEIKDR